jgi:hypothetical protein
VHARFFWIVLDRIDMKNLLNVLVLIIVSLDYATAAPQGRATEIDTRKGSLLAHMDNIRQMMSKVGESDHEAAEDIFNSSYLVFANISWLVTLRTLEDDMSSPVDATRVQRDYDRQRSMVEFVCSGDNHGEDDASMPAIASVTKSLARITSTDLRMEASQTREELIQLCATATR